MNVVLAELKDIVGMVSDFQSLGRVSDVNQADLERLREVRKRCMSIRVLVENCEMVEVQERLEIKVDEISDFVAELESFDSINSFRLVSDEKLNVFDSDAMVDDSLSELETAIEELYALIEG